MSAMSGISAGRNDPCPCGSGKKYKKCCISRQSNNQMFVNSTPANSKDTLHEICRRLEECIVLHGYVNCVFWLFGISWKDAPAHAEAWTALQRLHEDYAQAESRVGDPRRVVVFRKDPHEVLDSLRSIRAILEESKQRWKTGLIKILCTDDELLRMTMRVREDGQIALPKTEFDKRFDVSANDPYWYHVPDHTLVYLGGGLRVSSPEYDMFRAMCCCHDRAILTGRQLEKLRQDIVSSTDDNGLVNLPGLRRDVKAAFNLEGVHLREGGTESVHVWELGETLGTLVALHAEEVRQVVVNSCLFVEAFVNSVAHAYRSTSAITLSPEDDLYLQERAIDKKPERRVRSLQRYRTSCTTGSNSSAHELRRSRRGPTLTKRFAQYRNTATRSFTLPQPRPRNIDA